MATPAHLTAEELEAWLAPASAEVRAIAIAALALVHDVLPDANETASRGDQGIGFGARQYGANGWGISYISIQSKYANLGFFKGASLPDPDGLLEGAGKNLRHVKLRSLQEVEARRDGLASLLKAAAGQ
ncbi:MAG: DUF1801 domain-containing protein [Chloroflexi bacterium]|nr:DUF1801 domain-containing protein [Chloroflexota bacterium]MDA1241134.1 DUF1801 domain-containing protein [Chloroflexota bacterium]